MENKDDRIGEENTEGEAKLEEQIPEGTNAESQVSRRRALIAGLAAAPVVLSLMNRSAWGNSTPQVSCTLVASYVNAGNRWQSPRPSNLNGTLPIGPDDINKCRT